MIDGKGLVDNPLSLNGGLPTLGWALPMQANEYKYLGVLLKSDRKVEHVMWTLYWTVVLIRQLSTHTGHELGRLTMKEQIEVKREFPL